MADDNQQEQHTPKERKVVRHLPYLIKILEIVSEYLSLKMKLISTIVRKYNAFTEQFLSAIIFFTCINCN